MQSPPLSFSYMYVGASYWYDDGGYTKTSTLGISSVGGTASSTMSGIPQAADLDFTMVVSGHGDIDTSSEYVDVYIDSMYRGRCEYKPQCGSYESCFTVDVTDSAIDGSLVLYADASSAVNYCTPYASIRFSLSCTYTDTPSPSSAPTPAPSLGLSGSFDIYLFADLVSQKSEQTYSPETRSPKTIRTWCPLRSRRDPTIACTSWTMRPAMKGTRRSSRFQPRSRPPLCRHPYPLPLRARALLCTRRLRQPQIPALGHRRVRLLHRRRRPLQYPPQTPHRCHHDQALSFSSPTPSPSGYLAVFTTSHGGTAATCGIRRRASRCACMKQMPQRARPPSPSLSQSTGRDALFTRTHGRCRTR